MKFIRLAYLLVLLFLLGCAQKFVLPEVDVPVSMPASVRKIPMTIGILVPDDAARKTEIWVQPEMNSNTVTLDAPTAKMLSQKAPQIFSSVFERVVLVRGEPYAPGIDAVLVPDVKKLGFLFATVPNFPMAKTKFESQVTVKSMLVDTTGMPIWEREVKAPTPSNRVYQMSPEDAWDVMMGKVVTESVIEALKATANEIKFSKEINAFANRKSAPVNAAKTNPMPETVIQHMQQTNTPAIPTTTTAPTATTENLLPHTMQAERENYYAVVIGIEKYQSLPSSDYSKADATLVREHLKALGFADRNIEFIADEKATYSGIRKAVESWLPRRVSNNSKVVVYFAGHGAPEPQSGDSYLVPYDGDPNYLLETGYPLRRLYEKLEGLPAKEVIVLLDACFTGSGGRSVLAQGARSLVRVEKIDLKKDNIAVLTSTQGSQISTSSQEKKHGLFTYFLLKALNDGNRNLSDIYEYVRLRVENEAKRLNVEQSPAISPDPASVKGRFAL